MWRKNFGIKCRKEKVTINDANNEKVNLMSTSLEIGLESLYGRVDTVVVITTSRNTCDVWRHVAYQLAGDKRSVEAFKEHSLSKT